ncbi:MAG: hypothetical protein R2742_01015 [Micropruina glycogenica]
MSATDPVTGWTMLRSIRNNAFVHVHAGLEWIAKLAPLPIGGMDPDEKPRFMNWSVIAWCDDHHIVAQPAYHHNDNALREQRNVTGSAAAFRYRYETDTELASLLNQLWDLVMAHGDFTSCPASKPSTGPRPAATASPCRDKLKTLPAAPRHRHPRRHHHGTRLAAEHDLLNPARITRGINHIQQQLIDLAKARTLGTRPAA